MYKTVLMIAYHFPPSNSVGMQRTVRFVRYLSSFGWRPVVLTAREQDLAETPLDRAWQERLPVELPVYRSRVWRPLRVAVKLRDRWRRFRSMRGAPRTQMPPHPKPLPQGSEGTRRPQASEFRKTWVQRWVDPWFMTPDEEIGWLPSAVWTGVRVVVQHKVEVVYTSGPPHSTHLIGAMLKGLTRRPWAADFRDPWTRRPWLQAADRQGLRYRLLVKLEAWLVHYADHVVLNTESMAEEFCQFYPAEPRDKFTAIPNGYDPDTFPVLPIVDSSPAKTFTVTHAGSLYRRRDPRPLLDAVARLRQQGVLQPGTFRLNLIGSLDPDFQVPERIQSLQLQDWVTVLPPVSYRESLGYLARSHLLLLIQPDTHLQVPGKLFEYLYLGKPILALTGAGATAEFMHKHQLGRVVEPGQQAAIAATLGQYYQQFRRGEWTPIRCEEALTRFHAHALTCQLATLFDKESTALITPSAT